MASTKKRAAQLDREINDILTAPRGQRQPTAKGRARSGRSSSGSPGIPSQAEYERRELADAQRVLVDRQRAPLAERKEAKAEFLGAMRDNPEIVGERIGWLLGGNYGYGAMMLAKRVLDNPRMNRSAALTQLIGAFEWQCPEDMTRAAWNELSAAEKARLETHVQDAIRSAESEA